MKRINSVTILVINIFLLLVVLNFYKNSVENIEESQKYLLEIQNVYSNYSQSKESLYKSKQVEKVLRKIIKQLNMKNVTIVKTGKKLLLKGENISLKKQDRLFNKILNEKFIILKSSIEKGSIMMEIGL